MNYFKEAEKVLSHRRQLEKAKNNLVRRKIRLMGAGIPADVSSIDPAKPSVSGGMVRNTLQDCIDLAQTQRDLTATKEEIGEIDSILDQLAENDCHILKLWYVEGMDKDEICDKLHMSRSTLYDSRAKAIDEFAVLYFGAGALRAL